MQGDLISYKCFVRLWNKDFRWLKLRRNKTIKSKCNVCEDLEVRHSIAWHLPICVFQHLALNDLFFVITLGIGR